MPANSALLDSRRLLQHPRLGAHLQKSESISISLDSCLVDAPDILYHLHLAVAHKLGAQHNEKFEFLQQQPYLSSLSLSLQAAYAAVRKATSQSIHYQEFLSARTACIEEGSSGRLKFALKDFHVPHSTRLLRALRTLGKPITVFSHSSAKMARLIQSQSGLTDEYLQKTAGSVLRFKNDPQSVGENSTGPQSIRHGATVVFEDTVHGLLDILKRSNCKFAIVRPSTPGHCGEFAAISHAQRARFLFIDDYSELFNY